MQLSEPQIQSLAPNPAAFAAGKKLSGKEQWQTLAVNDRAIWGAIKGSGSIPYLVQIDTQSIAYKCTCPSRQFPCKHSIGLMLVYHGHASSFEQQEEPEWVKAWMDKRVAKEKSKDEKEHTHEEQEQLGKNREKTQQNRLAMVRQAADELELWLKDLVRMGLLELPSKSKSELDRVAARMVDAKAPGLGGWVKALGRLPFHDQQAWQSEALIMLAKMFLLVSAIKNFEQLSPEWQQSLRTLAGWSQSGKELLADTEAETVKDHWLVAGQEVETTEEEITIQRNWLTGIHSGRQALILNFGTKFSALESTFLPGTVVEGELAYFPSVWPHRGIFKAQRNMTTTLPAPPSSFSSWTEVHHYKVAQLRTYPWLNDILVVLDHARIVRNKQSWIICDGEQSFMPVQPTFDPSKIMRWLAISGNRKMKMAIVLRNQVAIPVGVFEDHQYHML